MSGTTHKRLHRLLKRDLGPIVTRSASGWTTTSNLPHEIRLLSEGGIDLVRVSAGMVVGTKRSKALLRAINDLNVERAFTRRFVVDGKVLIVAEMPVRSLRKGDLEHLVSMVFCLARLDAPALALHGGWPVTDPPAELEPDFDALLTSWEDVLRASRTATECELAVWLDELVGCDCWIDRDEDSVIVAMDGHGLGTTYPFTLNELRETAVELLNEERGEDA